jgi:hypothetical protein
MRRRYHTEVTIGSGTLERLEECARGNQVDMMAGTSSRRARASAAITAKVTPVSLMFSVSNPAGQCTRSECGAITA